eukprot:m.85891 g.85891  ORF g.85891 m.85891 type:complete len:329 (+) comp50893_c0_seq1:76-1062(+)
MASEIAVAIAAVVAAAGATEAVRAGIAQQITKADSSPVTVADFAAQAIVNMALSEHFPYPIVGEEDSADLKGDSPQAVEMLDRVVKAVQGVRPEASPQRILEAIDLGSHAGGATGRFWALDPVDGTKGFLRNDQYAIALGLIENGEVILGVLGCPNLSLDLKDASAPRGTLFYATKGTGTFVAPISDPSNARRVHVTDSDDSSECSVLESVESGHTSHDDSKSIMSLLNVTAQSLRMDSQAKYGALSRADGSILLRLPKPGVKYVEKIWDHAAGQIVVQEAGGKVTDIRGKALDFSLGRTLEANVGVIATNGKVHDQVIAAVNKVIPE